MAKRSKILDRFTAAREAGAAFLRRRSRPDLEDAALLR
jgi:hypothetical protein